MKHSLLPVLLAFGTALIPPLAPAQEHPEALNGEFQIHHGFKVFQLKIPQGTMNILAPENPAPGRPWVLGSDNHAPLDIDAPKPPVTANMARTQFELARRGFHVVSLALGNTFGAPQALEKWDAVYEELTRRYGFSKKLAMMGLSRNGLAIARWAAMHPGRVSCLYMDKAVCDIKSWPGGKLPAGGGSRADWESLLKVFGFESEQAALEWRGNPVDLAPQLAKDGVAIVYVAGAKDTGVPYADNGALMEKVYKQLNAPFELIWRENEGHHPHGLLDPAPVVDFILKHTLTPNPQPHN